MRVVICLAAFAGFVAAGCTGSPSDWAVAPNTTEPDSFGGESDADAADSSDRLTTGDVQAEAKEAFQTAQKFVDQEQQEYRQQASARLNKIQQHIDALRRQLDQAAPTASTVDLQKLFKRMEQQLADARKQATEQRAESRETWNELRTAVDQAIDELETSADDVRKQLKADSETSSNNQEASDPPDSGGAGSAPADDRANQ